LARLRLSYSAENNRLGVPGAPTLGKRVTHGPIGATLENEQGQEWQAKRRRLSGAGATAQNE
jgi:hypothetical protein